LIASVPFRTPAALGLNVTVIEQLEPGATVVQLFVCEKSPVIVTLPINSVVLPLFEMVTFCAAGEVPTSAFPKASELGATEASAGGSPTANIRFPTCFAGVMTEMSTLPG
jgi:hypothetical protein